MPRTPEIVAIISGPIEQNGRGAGEHIVGDYDQQLAAVSDEGGVKVAVVEVIVDDP